MIGTIDKKIILDLEKVGVQQRILARQGDSLVYRVTITLKKGGASFFPADVIMAELRAILPSGKTVTADCEIADGKCTVVPGAGFFVDGGPVLCRLILRGEDGAELYSPAFAFDTETTFASENAAEAEAYSRIAELLMQVQEIKKECEEIASTVGMIETVKTSLATRDHFVVFNLLSGKYERIQWTNLRSIIKNYLDGEIVAGALYDEAETGYKACIPELDDDDYIVVGSQLEDALSRISVLEAKVK